MQPIELSPVFRDFLPWLGDLQHCFSIGFKHKPSCVDENEVLPESVVALIESRVHPAQFDGETLGGYIKYATVITPVRYLTGELEGLVICDPKFSSAPMPSVSAGATQINR